MLLSCVNRKNLQAGVTLAYADTHTLLYHTFVQTTGDNLSPPSEREQQRRVSEGAVSSHRSAGDDDWLTVCRESADNNSRVRVVAQLLSPHVQYI